MLNPFRTRSISHPPSLFPPATTSLVPPPMPPIPTTLLHPHASTLPTLPISLLTLSVAAVEVSTVTPTHCQTLASVTRPAVKQLILMARPSLERSPSPLWLVKVSLEASMTSCNSHHNNNNNNHNNNNSHNNSYDNKI